MIQIISDLFVNATILIASVSVGNIAFKKMQFNTRADIILGGVFSGILGCILILYGVNVTPTHIIDFRMIPIVLLSLYSSRRSAIIAAAMITLFRVGYFGLSAATVTAVVSAIIITAGCCIISALRIKLSHKWICSNILILAVAFISFAITLEDSLFWITLTSYYIGVLIISISLFYLLEALRATEFALEKATEESNTDYLTGLLNLRQLNHSLTTSIQHAQNQSQHLSVLYIDIDNFKGINDVYGHDEGDKVLKSVGRILLETSRNFDIVSRRGGDEFTVILVDCDLIKAEKIANRIQRQIGAVNYQNRSGERYQVTVSIGIASYPETTSDDKRLMQQADDALYKAKQSGKNTFKIAERKK